MSRLFTLAAFTSLLLLGAGSALAQGTVKGVVTDSTSGLGLPGVNVRIEGTTLGAATNLEGEYEINSVPLGAQNVFASFIGYTSKRAPITVTGGVTTVDFVLSDAIVLGENVVVTALGIVREERSLGYSAQEVGGEDLTQARETNVITSLAGRVAGANVTQGNALGGSARIVLRGPGSVSGNNEPLFVVDGVPLDNSNFTSTAQASGSGGYDYGNAASLINPDDIASVSILKGPSAGALYGARAANGVILITTKSGRRNTGIGVTVNQSVTSESVYNLPPYQNEYGGGNFAPFQEVNGQLRPNYGVDESWGPRLDGRMVRQWYSFDNVNGLEGQTTPWVAQPNNIQNFFDTGVTSNTNLAFAQGGENFNYRLSLTNVSTAGIFPGSSLDRRQVSFNGSLDLSSRLRSSVSANFTNNAGKGRPGTGYDGQNVFQQFSQFGQRQYELGRDGYMYEYRRPDGTQRGWNWRDPIAGTLAYSDNPYFVRYASFEQDNTNRLFGNVTLDYDFTDFLSLTTNVQRDYYTDRREERVGFGAVSVPEYSEAIREVQETSARTQLNLERDLTQDVSLNTFVGGEVRYNSYNRNVGTTRGGLAAPGVFTLENSIDRPIVDDYFQELAVYSVYGDVTLGYRDFAYINGTFRNDVSSTLPDGDNSYFYPSVNASLVFSDLGPFRNQSILSYGKVRAGFAAVGNDTEPYRTALTYPLGTPFGANPLQSLPTTLPNLELKPERTSSFEAGLELAFFNNRIGLDLTGYTEETTDQILPVEVSRATGYSRQFVNAGSISNKGVEIALRTTPVILDNGFQWDLNFNAARNVSRVNELIEGLDVYTLGTAPFGPRIAAAVDQPYGAIVGSDFVRDANGNVVVNVNSAGNFTGYAKTASNNEILGSYLPDWTGGISTTLSYKGVQFSGLLDGQLGGDIFSLTALWGRYSGILDRTVEDNVRQLGVIPENVVVLPAGADPATTVGTPYAGSAVSARSYFAQAYSGPNAINIFDASFIRLRELSLGFSVPTRYVSPLRLQGLQVSVIARNIATLYKETPYFDPAVALSSGNVQGIEAGSIPPSRSIGISLTANI